MILLYILIAFCVLVCIHYLLSLRWYVPVPKFELKSEWNKRTGFHRNYGVICWLYNSPYTGTRLFSFNFRSGRKARADSWDSQQIHYGNMTREQYIDSELY